MSQSKRDPRNVAADLASIRGPAFPPRRPGLRGVGRGLRVGGDRMSVTFGFMLVTITAVCSSSFCDRHPARGRNCSRPTSA